MMPSVKAEFRKLWTVRSTYALFLFALAPVIIFAFYAEGLRAAPASLSNHGLLASEIHNAVMTVSLIGSIAGVLLMTHEYRYNTIMYTLTASNSRVKTLLAKVVAISVFSVIFTVVFGLLAPFLTWLGIHIKGQPLTSQEFDVFSLAWRGLFVGWAFQMIALGLAALVRNQIAVIVILFMAPSTLEPLVGLLLKHNAIYLPFSAITQVLQHQMVGGELGPGAVHIALSYGRAALIVLAYLAVIWLLAVILFKRRDAN
jgi:ABC-2 type transport system permease protein